VRWLTAFLGNPRAEILLDRSNRLSVSHPPWRSHDPPGFLAHHQT